VPDTDIDEAERHSHRDRREAIRAKATDMAADMIVEDSQYVAFDGCSPEIHLRLRANWNSG